MLNVTPLPSLPQLLHEVPSIHDLVNDPRSVYARACIFKNETIISESIVIGNAYGRKMFKWATFHRMVDNIVDLPEFTLPTSVHSIS
jgi:hypothetical protein